MECQSLKPGDWLGSAERNDEPQYPLGSGEVEFRPVDVPRFVFELNVVYGECNFERV